MSDEFLMKLKQIRQKYGLQQISMNTAQQKISMLPTKKYQKQSKKQLMSKSVCNCNENFQTAYGLTLKHRVNQSPSLEQVKQNIPQKTTAKSNRASYWMNKMNNPLQNTISNNRLRNYSHANKRQNLYVNNGRGNLSNSRGVISGLIGHRFEKSGEKYSKDAFRTIQPFGSNPIVPNIRLHDLQMNKAANYQKSKPFSFAGTYFENNNEWSIQNISRIQDKISAYLRK